MSDVVKFVNLWITLVGIMLITWSYFLHVVALSAQITHNFISKTGFSLVFIIYAAGLLGMEIYVEHRELFAGDYASAAIIGVLLVQNMVALLLNPQNSVPFRIVDFAMLTGICFAGILVLYVPLSPVTMNLVFDYVLKPLLTVIQFGDLLSIVREIPKARVGISSTSLTLFYYCFMSGLVGSLLFVTAEDGPLIVLRGVLNYAPGVFLIRQIEKFMLSNEQAYCEVYSK